MTRVSAVNAAETPPTLCCIAAHCVLYHIYSSRMGCASRAHDVQNAHTDHSAADAVK
jgi:hypothetical protein